MGLPLFGSSCADDETYDPYFARIRDRVCICLDGRPVKDVIAFDCREGWVRVVDYRHGRGYPIPKVHDGLLTERVLRGLVTVFGR